MGVGGAGDRGFVLSFCLDPVLSISFFLFLLIIAVGSSNGFSLASYSPTRLWQGVFIGTGIRGYLILFWFSYGGVHASYVYTRV